MLIGDNTVARFYGWTHFRADMFWLLVFLAVAGTLAYRATPLPTATGVLGVTVLLYGWLGESAGHFLLLLLGWLLLFVPLNTVALRQEWYSRPLLDRWLAQSPPDPAPLPEAGPAAGLLEGETTGLPRPEIPAETPDAELRAEALAAALAARLRNPLQPAEPQEAQARVAEYLYVAAALKTQAPRLLARELPDSGQLVRTALAWPLAAQAGALRGLAPEASLDWAALGTDTLIAERLGAAHRPSRALREAGRLDSAATRLIAFDEVLWPLIGQGLGASLRSFVGSFLARLPASGDESALRHSQWLALAGQRLAALMALRALLPLLARLPTAFETALARIVHHVLAAQAAQAWHAASRQPGGERPLLESLLRRHLHDADEAVLAALRELSHPLWSGLLRAVLMPLPRLRPPTATETRAAAEALLREPELRARLVAGLPSQEALQALNVRVETLRQLEPTLRRLRLARFEPPPADDAALLASATRLGLLSDAESATLSEALAFAANQLKPETQ